MGKLSSVDTRISSAMPVSRSLSWRLRSVASRSACAFSTASFSAASSFRDMNFIDFKREDTARFALAVTPTPFTFTAFSLPASCSISYSTRVPTLRLNVEELTLTSSPPSQLRIPSPFRLDHFRTVPFFVPFSVGICESGSCPSATTAGPCTREAVYSPLLFSPCATSTSASTLRPTTRHCPLTSALRGTVMLNFAHFTMPCPISSFHCATTPSYSVSGCGVAAVRRAIFTSPAQPRSVRPSPDTPTAMTLPSRAFSFAFTSKVTAAPTTRLPPSQPLRYTNKFSPPSSRLRIPWPVCSTHFTTRPVWDMILSMKYRYCSF
eukprot:Rhum_TRINITY_DN21012_c0_g1::Rhum_TRINITY_DN21012_c0_g1_i1::g.172910::m.172910